MNKSGKRLKKYVGYICFSLSLVMLFTMVPGISFASENDKGSQNQSEQAKEEPKTPGVEQPKVEAPKTKNPLGRRLKICLDPGHAGYQNQGIIKKYYESVMTWTLVGYLKKELEKYPNVEVKLTKFSLNQEIRKKNGEADIYKRGTLAKGCDIFISIHSNDAGSGKVAEKVDYPLAIVSAKTKKNGSKLYNVAAPLGKRLAISVESTMKTRQDHRVWVKKQKGDRDWYGVIRGAAAVKVPGIILEHSFHSNKRMCEWLLNKKNLKKMAKNEAAVIAKYYGIRKTDEIIIPVGTVKNFNSWGYGTYTSRAKWSKVSGVDGYRLYRSTSKNGKYKMIAETQSTSYTDKNLIPGMLYYYKARAYKIVNGKKHFGSYSSVNDAKPRPTRSTVKLTAQKNSIKISFTKVPDITGYRIYRATSKNGSYKIIKTSSTLKKTYYWIDRNVKKKKTYYYKVRGYKSVKGYPRAYGYISYIRYARCR